MRRLAQALREGARLNPNGIAIREHGGSEIAYGDLDALCDRFASVLDSHGVGAGHRVAIWLEKSITAVAAMQATLRLGAAYVPIDAGGPEGRALRVIEDCRPTVCLVPPERLPAFDRSGLRVPALAVERQGHTIETVSHELRGSRPAVAEDVPFRDLAYILYTSGSTGRPKGVCISNENALAFVDWAREELQPQTTDRFANHAPLHFDLSVLDLYVAFQGGAGVVLVPDGIAMAGGRLVDLIHAEEVTVWYSVPSVLTLMIEHGGLLDSRNALRAILFAGEVFAVKYVRMLRKRFPGVRLLNLFGPTETNVCCFEEVFEVAEDRSHPVPIGRPCAGARLRAIKEDGAAAAPGEKGELVVEGPTVMQGYWDGHPQIGPYRTGDIVRQLDLDRFEYVGRMDSMVKIRGNRVDLGEVEAAVVAHPKIEEAAVLARGAGMETRLVAFAAASGRERPTLLEMKRHCALHLPRYMIIQNLKYVECLPRNVNGKVDRQALTAMDLEAVT